MKEKIHLILGREIDRIDGEGVVEKDDRKFLLDYLRVLNEQSFSDLADIEAEISSEELNEILKELDAEQEADKPDEKVHVKKPNKKGKN